MPKTRIDSILSNKKVSLLCMYDHLMSIFSDAITCTRSLAALVLKGDRVLLVGSQ